MGKIIERFSNNCRGRRYYRHDKKNKLAKPHNIFNERFLKYSDQYKRCMLLDLGIPDVFKSLKEKRFFQFDAGWCTNWPGTLGVMKENMIKNIPGGWLRLSCEKLNKPEEGWYWDEKKQKRIYNKFSVATPYMQSTFQWDPPFIIMGWVRLTAFTGGWTAPLWLGFNCDGRTDYEEIDLAECWYGDKKSHANIQVNNHYWRNNERRQNPSNVKFKEPHKDREVLMICKVTQKQVKVWFDDLLVYKTKTVAPTHKCSLISSSCVQLLGGLDMLGLYASLPGYFDIKKVAIFTEQFYNLPT